MPTRNQIGWWWLYESPHSERNVVNKWAERFGRTRKIEHTCWKCGDLIKTKGMGVRAHIEAHKNGGSSKPENFFMLCVVCHLHQPDAMTRPEQIEWIQRPISHEKNVAIEMIYAYANITKEDAETAGVYSEDVIELITPDCAVSRHLTNFYSNVGWKLNKLVKDRNAELLARKAAAQKDSCSINL